MDITLKDALTLARAGYKKAEIQEILEAEKKAEQDSTSAAATDSKVKEAPEITIQDEAKESCQKTNDEKQDEPEIDYKALYEESQKKLKAAQSENIHNNIEGEIKSDEQKLDEIISELI